MIRQTFKLHKKYNNHESRRPGLNKKNEFVILDSLSFFITDETNAVKFKESVILLIQWNTSSEWCVVNYVSDSWRENNVAW